MTTMILECRAYKATPLGEGKIRLEVEDAAPSKANPKQAYEAKAATKRLSELLGREVGRNNLAYWRENLNLPHKKLGPRKFIYFEGELVRWATGRTLLDL
jgi:hypothetical protein